MIGTLPKFGCDLVVYKKYVNLLPINVNVYLMFYNLISYFRLDMKYMVQQQSANSTVFIGDFAALFSSDLSY